MSRNQREGRYVGRCRRKEVRRKKDLPALYVEDQCGNKEELFPAFKPFVDSSIAQVTYNARVPAIWR